MTPPEPTESPPSEVEARRESSMRIDFTLSIGYTRRRPSGVTVDRWEARMDSLGLIVVGAVATVVILVITVPRIIEALTHP